MKGVRGKRVNVPKRGFDLILAAGVVVIAVVYAYTVYHQAVKEPAAETVAGGTRSRPATVLKPAVAGGFYPSSAGELSSSIDRYLSEANPAEVYGVRGLVLPHAGYVYSGPVAAYGFKLLEDRRYETVIVMGPSHYHGFSGASIPNFTYYETPLGRVEISPKVGDMYKEGLFTYEPEAHVREHSVEVQIPFLQKVLPTFKIIPIVVGDAGPDELADALLKYVDDDTLIIASSDLSHYYPYGQAIQLDRVCTKAIPAYDYNSMRDCQACGRVPVMALMRIAEKKGWKGLLLDYRNSGDTAGDKMQGVVGYSSIAFYDGLVEDEQEFLLKLARDTLASYYRDGSEPAVDESKLTAKLREKKACFVTLNKNGQLRGCIGHLTAQVPLYECVIENALNAALHDTRFNPVDARELPGLEIEVSVLSDPRILPHDGPQDLLNKLIPGTDGVVIKYGWRQSTYLPVVWEMLPDKEEFLSSLCEKQGSSPDCWQSKDAEIHTYQAQKFEE